MNHSRKQIRDAVKAALLGLPATAARVHVGRMRPLAKDHQPTLLISTPGETSSRDANGRPPILARSLRLWVEIRVVSAEPPDDQLDEIAAQVEQALWDDQGLGNMLQNIQFVEMQQVVEAVGDKHNGGQRLEYRLTYRTHEGSPRILVQ